MSYIFQMFISSSDDPAFPDDVPENMLQKHKAAFHLLQLILLLIFNCFIPFVISSSDKILGEYSASMKHLFYL